MVDYCVYVRIFVECFIGFGEIGYGFGFYFVEVGECFGCCCFLESEV